MPIYKGDTPIVEASGRKGKDGKDGINGENGATYTPSISEEGILSWTNDKNLPNPEPINVKGQDGVSYTLTKSEDGTKIILTGSDGSIQEILDSNTIYSVATQTESGLMSAEDKVKLNNISSGGGTTLPVGVIVPIATSTAPSGWLICDGSEVSRETYSALFSAIGTTYGIGDGSTTFNLPNLKGKIPVGYDANDTDFNAVGKTGGEKTHTLTVNEMPTHSHTTTYGSSSTSSGYPLSFSKPEQHHYYKQSNVSSNTTGGGQAHNIMQPYITMNYIIYAGV